MSTAAAEALPRAVEALQHRAAGSSKKRPDALYGAPAPPQGDRAVIADDGEPIMLICATLLPSAHRWPRLSLSERRIEDRDGRVPRKCRADE